MLKRGKTEAEVRDDLYGLLTRSGVVRKHDPIGCTVLIAHDRVNHVCGLYGLFRTIEPWMKWDTISWDWPENPEKMIDGYVRSAEHAIAHTFQPFGHSHSIAI